MDAYQKAFDGRRNDLSEKHVVGPVCHISTDGSYGNIVNDIHNRRKNRQCQYTVSHDPVDFVGNRHLFAGMFFAAAFSDNGGNIIIPLVGDDAFRIVVHLVLNLRDLCRDIRNRGKLLRNLVILFQKFNGKEPSLFGRNRTSQFIFDGIQHFLHSRIKVMYRWIILTGSCKLNGFFCSLHNTVAFQRGNLHHRTAQLLRQFFCHDLIAVFPYKIHHIDGHHHRDPQLHKLCAEIKVSLQVRTVNDVQDRVRLLIDQIVPGYNLLQCIGRKGINSRKVGDHNVFVSFQLSFFLLHSYSRPVSHELVRSGQCVEQGRLSTVGIAGQCNR